MKQILTRLAIDLSDGCGCTGRGRLSAHLLKRLFLLACLVGLVLLTGCGGKNVRLAVIDTTTRTGTTTGTVTSTAHAAVLVNVAGIVSMPPQILSLSIGFEGIALRTSKGDFVSVSSDYRSVELSRLNSTTEPLLLGDVVAGNYTATVIYISGAAISFIDAAGVLHEHVPVSLTSPTTTIELPISIGSAPVFFNLALMGSAITFGEGNTVSMTPRFVSTAPVAVQNAVGIVNGLVARITDVEKTSFGIAAGPVTGCCFPGFYPSFDIATDATSEFEGLPGFGALTQDMTVEMNANFEPDGTLRATKVHLENALPKTVVLEGVAYTLKPGQLQMVVRESLGPYDDDLFAAAFVVGSAIGINVSTSTLYNIASENVDLKNLDFLPSFTAVTMAPGQNVRSVGPGPDPKNTTADVLKLEEQSLEGTAGALTPGSVSGQYSFPLTLPAGAALAQITGSTSILVTVQPSTWLDTGDPMAACVTCIPGKQARVRGLLFYSGSQYRLVASNVAVD